MNALLILLLAFPGQRIANLPTGVLPESHVWQLNISHRFVPAVLAPDWTKDPLQLFGGANVRDVLDKSLGGTGLVGFNLTINTREVGLHGAWAPLSWLTVYPELNTHLYGFKLDSTWFNARILRPPGVRRASRRRGSSPATPRTTKSHFISLGVGGKVQFLPSWSAGVEAEPVLRRSRLDHRKAGVERHGREGIRLAQLHIHGRQPD